MIQTYKKNGLTHISLENKFIKAVFLPEIGGKIKELINLESGTQYLLDNQNPDGNYSTDHYGADFSKYDVSGFDDCFPTIDPCVIDSLKNKYSKYSFPDHGEVWSRPWKYSISDNSVTFTISGEAFKYLLTKQYRLEENRITITYTLKNLSAEALPYIWSAHPLLKISEGARIILPKEVEMLYLNWASDAAIGKHGDIIQWPFILGSESTEDYSIVKDKQHNLALKCYTDELSDGYAGVYLPDKEESIFFSFDAGENPYIGLWLCYGGWPPDDKNKHFTIGIEPSNGRPDSLAEAVKNRECSIINEYSENKWELEISLWSGTPSLKLFRGKNLLKKESIINQ